MANRGFGWDSVLRLMVTVTECGGEASVCLSQFFGIFLVGDD